MSEFDSSSNLNDGSVDSGNGGMESGSPAQTSSPIGGGTEQDSINPAWEPVLKDLPDFFHPKAKQHFKQWDENYNKLDTQYKELQGRYQPYEPYLNVDPQHLQYAMGVYQALNSDPKAVYERLQTQLRQMKLLDPEPSTGEPVPLEQQDPMYRELEERQRQLDARQQQMDQFIQTETYNKTVATHEAAIDRQIQGLIGKYGEVVDVEDVLQRMFIQAQQGKQFDAEAAFNEQKQVFQRLYKKQGAGRPAPNIIPTNGTPAPSGTKKPEDMNEEERKAYFKQLLDIANTGG